MYFCAQIYYPSLKRALFITGPDPFQILSRDDIFMYQQLIFSFDNKFFNSESFNDIWIYYHGRYIFVHKFTTQV